MENNEEIKDQDMNEEYREGGFKQWLQDNLRIIISVLIVVIIAGGIYSYSKRAEAPVASNDQKEQSADLANITGTDENQTNQDQNNQSAATDQDNKNQAPAQNQDQTKSQQQDKSQNQTSATATSQETENSFVETAAHGDSITTLARQALANYLEKNSDSSLTAEHKIYIEDYLVKNSGHRDGINIGTSVEFQKDLIQKAVSASKNLNEQQLQNLHKYAVRVPSLS